MMDIILVLYHEAKKALSKGVSMSEIMETGFMEKVIKVKYDIPNDKPEMFEDYRKEITDTFAELDSKADERRAV